MMFCFLDTVPSCVYFSFDELPTKFGENERRKNKTKKLIVSVDVSSAVQLSCSSCYYNRWGWNDSNANRRRPLSTVFSKSFLSLEHNNEKKQQQHRTDSKMNERHTTQPKNVIIFQSTFARKCFQNGSWSQELKTRQSWSSRINKTR